MNQKDIYVSYDVVMCDLSSVFFTAIYYDLVVIIIYNINHHFKDIHPSLMNLISSELKFFYIYSSNTSEISNIVQNILADEAYLLAQSKARVRLRKALFWVYGDQSAESILDMLDNVS